MHRLKVNAAYTRYDQKLYWGNFSINQFYVKPEIYLKKNWILSSAFNLSLYNSNINYDTTYSYSSVYSDEIVRVTTDVTEQYVISGKNYQQNYLALFSLSKINKIGQFSTQFGYASSSANPNYVIQYIDTINEKEEYFFSPNIVYSQTIIDTIILPEKTTYTQFSAGLNAIFNLSEFIKPGFYLTYIYNSNKNYYFNISPVVNFHFSKSNVMLQYLTKKDYFYYIFDGYQLYDNFNTINKISVTYMYSFSKVFSMAATWQTENVDYIIEQQKVNYQSVYLGMKINF